MSGKNDNRTVPLLPVAPGTSSCRVHKRTLGIGLVVGVSLIVTTILVVVFVILPREHHNDGSSSPYELAVNTTYGDVLGFYYNFTAWNEEVTTVKAWRGVPFAAPPVGDLRWKAPQPPQSWTGALNCTEFKDFCVQPDGSGSEDCLYLNIYTSISASDPGPWPVYFDIYGGGLTGGSAQADFNGLIYSSASTRQGKGLVVVAPSYRLNIFGFLATEQLTEEQNGTSGNYGIQDQIAALRWVKENIASFNGDPNNVIIGGFSSGGTSVFGLLSSPSAKGLFAAAMSYSGSTNVTMDLPTAQIQNAPIVNATGCELPDSTYEEINACMREMSSDELVDLIPDSWYTPGIWGLPLSPHGQGYAGLIIVDGTVITNSFSSALAQGIVDVPFLFGHMGMEPDESPDMYVGGYNNSQWYDLLNETFSAWPQSQEVTNKMYQLYLNDSSQDAQKAYDRIVADYGLFCSQIVLAKNALPPKGVRTSPMYLYYDGKSLPLCYLASSHEVIVDIIF
jgi:carboxylesterase type B